MGQHSAMYNNPRWRAVRAAQLAREPLCRLCLARGQYTHATVCDHLQPHHGDWAAFWAGPFQSLCQQCHSVDKQRAERNSRPRPAIGADGWPVGGGG